MRHFKVTSLFFALFLISFFGMAQDCTLDIGGKNYNTIADIFQFNKEQNAIMETLRGELEISNRATEEEIQKLFNEHPQSTEEDLIALADKYKVLQRKMVNTSWETDKKMLSAFNPRQYERYLSLCMEAMRDPIKIIPVSYKDSVIPD